MLTELIHILYMKKYFRPKRDLFAFFQSTNKANKVYWDAKKKYHLVYLLSRLFNEGFASITGNRGYFSCAELVFCEMDGRPFKQNSLKKINMNIRKNRGKYSQVCKEVDDIITRISNIKNGKAYPA